MAATHSATATLNVSISRSPLLPAHPVKDDILSALLTTTTAATTTHITTTTTDISRAHLSRIQLLLHSSNSAHSRHVPPPPPKETLQVLSLLDRFDLDVSSEVARVKEGIREARELIGRYKHIRDSSIRSRTERRRQEKRETKGIDSEFWLGV